MMPFFDLRASQRDRETNPVTHAHARAQIARLTIAHREGHAASQGRIFGRQSRAVSSVRDTAIRAAAQSVATISALL